MDKIKAYSRRVDILRALNEHGPLSVKGLAKIIDPPMKDRRLRDAVKRLNDKGKRSEPLLNIANSFNL